MLVAHAQNQRQKSDVGIFFGDSYYLGDLNPATPYKDAKYALGGFFRQNFNKRISLRYAFTYGTVTASDADSDDPYRQNRNLSFKSPLYEFAGIVEINYVSYKTGNKDKFAATPYIFIGLGLTHIKPQAYVNNRWYELQPLGTEGQGSSISNRKKYALNQIVIPFGLGFKGNLTKRLVVGFEVGLRKMFTDYLDDVSGNYQNPEELAALNGPLAAALADRSFNSESYTRPGSNRGNPAGKDWYSFTGLMLSYVLGKEGRCYEFKKNRRPW